MFRYPGIYLFPQYSSDFHNVGLTVVLLMFPWVSLAVGLIVVLLMFPWVSLAVGLTVGLLLFPWVSLASVVRSLLQLQFY